MKITLSLLQALCPGTKVDVLTPYVDALNKLLPAHGITTPKRVASFLAQIIHESGAFKYRLENLNYSADGLLKTFRKYFTPALAAKYARKPEAIANRVYASRMGNGDEASGDGFKFRGKSLIQVTGKNNHVAFAKWIGMTLDDATAYLTTIEGAVAGAVWFWSANGLNELADGDQITNISKKINGGLIGIDERKALWRKALSLIG